MIKKINIRELRPGMYISDINVPWIHHPFLRKCVEVKSEKILHKIIHTGTWEVYIDTEKSHSVRIDELSQPVEKDVLLKIAKEAEKGEDSQIIYPLKDEIKEAEAIRREAKVIVKNIITSVRSGKSLTLTQAEEIVDKVVSSVLHHQHVLTSLSKMRQKNQFLFEHSISTCALMVAFSKSLGYDIEKQREIGIGGLLHDVGMSNISTRIINKPGKLSLSEYSEIKKHVEYGSNILQRTGNISDLSLSIAKEHHERFNGRGYPNNLSGDRISKEGQMMAIVDVYDAMTSNRGYRRAIHPSRALIELLNRSDKEFSSELIHRFIQSVGIYPFGTLVRLENGLIGIVIEVKKNSLLFPVIRVIFNKKNRISPYDIDLKDYDSDNNYKIAGIEDPRRLFISQDELNNILKLDIENG